MATKPMVPITGEELADLERRLEVDEWIIITPQELPFVPEPK